MAEIKEQMREATLKIALAAFLHDIGKFAQRARGDIASAGEPAFYPTQEFINSHRARLQPFNRKTNQYTHEHAVYTAAFIDHLELVLPECFKRTNWGGKTWVGELAAGHHFVKRDGDDAYVKEWHNFERWIIAVADRLSSALDRDGIKNFDQDYNRNAEITNFKSARLWPIMEEIKTKSRAEKQLEKGFLHRIPLKELREDQFFPAPMQQVIPADNAQGSKEYKKLFFEFVEELKGLEKFTNNVELWFEQFENLYMRYAGQIPAATVSPAMQDISLYDHSKITAAIAVALFIYHSETGAVEIADVENGTAEKLLFIGTDFFGIQKFIFASGGSTNKAAAKLLRGRSFYVSVMSELIGDMILRETGLPITSVIFNAAGQVTILAPNLPSIRQAVERVREQANRWLIERFYGQTSLGIATVAVSQNTITYEYRQMWQRLSRAMEAQKFQKFNLASLGGVQKQFFAEFNNALGVCSFCGQRPAKATLSDADGAPQICGLCSDQLELGARLVKASAIAIWDNSVKAFDRRLHEPIFGRYQIWLGKMGEAVDRAVNGSVISIARLTPSSEEPEWRKIAYKPFKGYVPVYSDEDERVNQGSDEEVVSGKIKSFEFLAQAAVKEGLPGEGKVGIAALGVLKADVDNLGMIFAMGLNKEIQTLTRISVLSRQFNNFFAIYLPSLLKKNYPNVYTVFSGGDDLFLIGPWCQILELAPVIRKEFADFVCQNGDITLSMGISIHKPGEPVAAMATAAEEALEKAKAEEGKDAVTIFGETVHWGELKDLYAIGSQVRGWINNKLLNTSMLYRFNHAVDELCREQELQKLLKQGKKVNFAELADTLSWKARLKYSMVRSRGHEAMKAGDEEARRAELENMIEWIEKHRTAMRIPLWQEIYGRRKR